MRLLKRMEALHARVVQLQARNEAVLARKEVRLHVCVVLFYSCWTCLI